MRQTVRLSIIVLLLGLTVVGSVIWTRPGCSLIGGKWGSAIGSCISPWCYHFGSCGNWAAPSRRCANVKVGDPVARVVFELGDPVTITDGRYWWLLGKGSMGRFDAEFVDGALVSINCPDRGPPMNVEGARHD